MVLTPVAFAQAFGQKPVHTQANCHVYADLAYTTILTMRKAGKPRSRFMKMTTDSLDPNKMYEQHKGSDMILDIDVISQYVFRTAATDPKRIYKDVYESCIAGQIR